MAESPVGNRLSRWLNAGATIARSNDFLRAFAKIVYAGGGYKILSWKKAQIRQDANSKRQVFADVSGLVRKDLGTGIQRTTRNLVYELSQLLGDDAKLVPVYAEAGVSGYHEASYPDENGFFHKTGTPIAAKKNDIFLGIDHVAWIGLSQLAAYRALRDMGVKLRFLVYDLIPINHPQWFEPGDQLRETAWLRELSKLGKFIAISRTVKSELQDWAGANGIALAEKPGWIHMGYSKRELDTGGGESGLALPEEPFFLVVGTIEPRKGHRDTLEAFKLLWQKDFPYSLVFIGRPGWKMEDFCQKLRKEAGVNKKFVWLENCSDIQLSQVYKAACALIMPAFAEGFGMPIVEAAAKGTPLILRDLPVFREIAGEGAFYFTGRNPGDIAQSLTAWRELKNHKQGGGQIRIESWRECAEFLLRQSIDS